MEKLVSESVKEFKNRKKLNEGEGFLNKLGQKIKGAFQKIGKFFFGTSDGEIVTGAIAPINIGVMTKNNLINPAISYIPNGADIALEPNLRSEDAGKVLNKRGALTESMKALFEATVQLEHPDKNVGNVDKNQLFRLIRLSLKNPESRPLMIWGAPGIGKTQIVQAVLKARGKGRLIDVATSKMAPDDWALPAIYKNESGEMQARDIPKNWLPVYIPTGDAKEDKKRDDIANQGEGGIIFFDELSRANPAVQNSCLKIMDEKLVGDAVLGSRWSLVAASNRDGDDPESDISFGKALGNRFTQVNYVPDFESWKEWAQDKIDPRILDFLEFNREYLYNMDDDPEQSIFASPRSWEEASRKVAMMMQDAEEENEPLSNKEVSDMVGYNVGMGIATEFNTFLKLLDTFRKEDIKKVLEDPANARMPKKAGSGFDQAEANALISLVCTSTRGRDLSPQELTNFAKYLVRLNNPSLATKGIKMMLDIHPYIHEELGEVEGRDKYKEGIDLFIEKYKDIF